MSIRDIRLQRLLVLLAEHSGRRAELAARLGKSPSQLSQWLGGHRTITEESARQIEARAKKPSGWLDASDLDAPPTQPLDLAQALPVVLGRLAAGLDDYTAGKVAGALQRAMQPAAPLEAIERDLLQWLSEPRTAGPADLPAKQRPTGT